MVAAAGGPADFDAFLERYRHPATPQEELRYLYALAGFPDPDLAARTFDLALSEVRTQNAPYLVAVAREPRPAVRPSGRVRDRLGRGASSGSRPTSLPDARRRARSCAATRDLADDVRAFLAAHPIAGAADGRPDPRAARGQRRVRRPRARRRLAGTRPAVGASSRRRPGGRSDPAADGETG